MQGLVTLEDILEEIVGDITDEHDANPLEKPQQTRDGGYILDGAFAIRDLNRELEWQLPEDIATTVAGLLINDAQMIPETGQVFEYRGYRFEVLERRAQRITRLKLRKLQEPHRFA